MQSRRMNLANCMCGTRLQWSPTLSWPVGYDWGNNRRMSPCHGRRSKEFPATPRPAGLPAHANCTAEGGPGGPGEGKQGRSSLVKPGVPAIRSNDSPSGCGQRRQAELGPDRPRFPSKLATTIPSIGSKQLHIKPSNNCYRPGIASPSPVLHATCTKIPEQECSRHLELHVIR